MIILGLVPVALGFILLGYIASRVAKKRGKNPWLWGSISVAALAVLSWQQLPGWAGYSTAYEMYAIHTIFSPWKHKVADPNAVETFTLAVRQRTSPYVQELPQKNAYTVNIPARYQAKQPSPVLVRMTCKYPSMEASPDSTLKERVVDVVVGTDLGHMSRPQFFLSEAARNKTNGEFIGKQGNYDVYQYKLNSDTTYRKWLFTAQDGQLVLVEEGVMDSREVWHDIGNDLVVNYGYWPIVGNDYIKIDEVVMAFVKAHLKAQPIQHKETVK
jgi:hypothetical protein